MRTQRVLVLSLARLIGLIILLGFSGLAVAGTIHVPSPTGVPSIDWDNIQQAVDSANANDRVKFGKGTYVLGNASEFIIVRAPGVRLVGHWGRRGTTIVGGEVLPTDGEVGSPWLMGNNSLLQSPPRGFRLTAAGQTISRIKFKSFRTAVMIGFGDAASSGGYTVKYCTFESTMYGIQGHVESDDVTAIRGNVFLNSTFPYDFSGGKYHVSFNFQATPNPENIPIDDFTHHSGTLAAGGPFYEEGGAFVTEDNVFEYNIVVKSAEGVQVIGDVGGVVRNNVFRHNTYYDMQECPNFIFGPCFSGLALVYGFGGDVIDNVWVNNTLVGSPGVPIAILNFGGSTEGNLIVGNELRSIANVSGMLPNWGVYSDGATNSIFLDNVITRDQTTELEFGGAFFGGQFNQFLLNTTDADSAALFVDSPDGLFASVDPPYIAVDQDGNPVASLDPNQDFTPLLRCKKFLTGSKCKKHQWYGVHHHRDAVSVEKFRSCVEAALGDLH